MHYKQFSILFILLCLAQNICGQPFSEKRTFKKSLSVNKEMTLEINNKYGSVQISSCKSDSVTIRAEVEASASNIERPGKMLQGITVNISETNYLIRAETEFSQTINMLLESFKGMTKKLIPYESRIQINYFIEAPEYLDIRITNKYGDVYLENSTGIFYVDLSNGSFKANSISGTAQMNLNFCDANINSVNQCKIDASFSEIVIGESQNLTISSVSSRFDLKKNKVVDTKSRRDKFFIGSINTIRGNSYFSDYRIENIDKEIYLDAKYGRIEAFHIVKGCEMINITSSYTDIYFTFDPSLSYNLDIKHTNAFLILPDGKTSVEKKVIDDDKKEFMTFGSVGKNPGNLKVIIEANRGNIYLK